VIIPEKISSSQLYCAEGLELYIVNQFFNGIKLSPSREKADLLNIKTFNYNGKTYSKLRRIKPCSSINQGTDEESIGWGCARWRR
jgi:hypothetical protein